MNRIITSIIKTIVIILIIVALFFCFIISHDVHHLEACHDDCCVKCVIIHIAQSVVNILSIVVLSISIRPLISLFLAKFYRGKSVFAPSSLVFKKVQLNE